MHSPRLRTLCTFEQSNDNTAARVEWNRDNSWTHRKLNGCGLFQLDYMLASEWVQSAARVVRGGFDLGSDHWPIDALLQLERKDLWASR